MPLLRALQLDTTCCHVPFLHWLIDQPLSPAMLDEAARADVSPRLRLYDGTRAGDHGSGPSERCFITPENVTRYPALASLIDELRSWDVVDTISDMLARPLHDGFLRVELITDRQGFWLKPHTDIPEKRMSMLLFVNPHRESEHLGTDLYDADLTRVKTVPYLHNFGYMFAPGENTWHGLELKRIQHERRSLMINYVTFETGWKLASRPARRSA